MNTSIFNYGTQAEYDVAVTRNMIEPSSLYFIIDTQRIYRGFDLVSMTSVFYVDSIPTSSTAREHTMYVVDRYVYIKIGNDIVCLNKELVAGAINSLSLFDTSILLTSAQSKPVEFTDSTIMTSKKVHDEIVEATNTSVVGARFNQESGTISFDLHKEGESFDLGLDGLVHDVKYYEDKYQLVIPIYGADDIVVDIPKCVKSGRYESNYLLPDGNYGKAIVLVIDAPNQDSGEKEIVIPADGLIQTYKPSESDSIKVTISDRNEIIGQVKVDPSETRLKVNKAGLHLDLSEYAMKANPQDVDKLAIIDANGQFVGSKKIVEIYKDADSEKIVDMIPTFGVVASAISEALKTIDTQVLEVGPLDMIVLSTETGVSRSTYKIGADKLNLNVDAEERLVATEAAVIDALSWSTI